MKHDNWTSILKFDPIGPLVASTNQAVSFFAARDLAGKSQTDPTQLWSLPAAQEIIRRQQDDGSWKYPGSKQRVRSAENYNQIETIRNLGYLIEMYGFDKTSPVITKAANFLLSFQTSTGDIRGILGNQYTPYYTAIIMELLIHAGYKNDRRIEKAFKWLRDIRQKDSGWTIPFRTHNQKLEIISTDAAALEPDKTKPFSHLVTGVVLRAYAADETYRQSAEAQTAGKLLLSRFFKKDSYTDRSSPDFWIRFTYPFWFTDIISATDSLSKLGFSKDEPQIAKAAQWLAGNQQSNGLWKLKTLKNDKKYNTDLWISLAICRVLKQLYLK
ncbi:MAG TPA: hypothetical protein VMR45_04600 [Patescibacteria group bacterium]|nr:hypothetical protein [Patescibacteria group bacterium]